MNRSGEGPAGSGDGKSLQDYDCGSQGYYKMQKWAAAINNEEGIKVMEPCDSEQTRYHYRKSDT